ncbi:MAG: flagellar filament capping protein FliD [Candidatus Gastranaerophilales bacterium]|nr:flagellar filament capping protein FliD [Candidatus Gastranaerophilales bacterium]
MSITVSGLGSGLDYESWIEELVAIKQADIDEVSSKVKSINAQETTLSDIENDYKAFLKAIETFTNALSTTDVFNQKTVTSSNDSAVTATVTSKASVQEVSVSVTQLATSTEAESTYAVASYATGGSALADLADGSFTEGSFSVYVDGTKTTLNLTGTKTLDELVTELNGIKNAGNENAISASISADGKLTIQAAGSSTVTVGSSSDTSNFANVMSLTRNTETGVYSSSKSIFDTDTDGSITSTTFRNSSGSDVSVTTGKFYISGVEFTIGASTSLDDIVDMINSSAAGVNAGWDPNTGKLKLTAEEEGAVSIDIAAGTSNFTDVMGLTESTWNPDGSVASTKIITDSQELGVNAILSVNGTTITSSSNTVTSDISGIAGLTLTLNDETTSAAKVSVTQDSSKISEAITTLVNTYNAVITSTDEATEKDGDLYGETVLSSIRNKVRKLITSAVSGEDGYNTLASIGISTGKFGTSTDANTDLLTIDTEKLNAALADNPNAVKRLLVGDEDAGTGGVLTQLETIVDNATNAINGYFVTREESYDKQKDRLNNKIEKMEDNLEKYKTQLEAKFSAMDKIISALQESASIFDYYFNNNNDDK